VRRGRGPGEPPDDAAEPEAAVELAGETGQVNRARLALTWWYVPATAVSKFADVVLTQQDGARLAARSPGPVTVGKGGGRPPRPPASRTGRR
jgi:hypothetical protein